MRRHSRAGGKSKVSFDLSAQLATLAATLIFSLAVAHAATVVALGASNTYGKGVSRSQSYPSQLEQILQSKGLSVHVINAGINGDTTAGMMGRITQIPNGTSVVILQPGGNDRRRGQEGERSANISEIERQLASRGIKVVLLENQMFRGLPHQPDGMHLTPEGYRMLAEAIAPQVISALGK
jgi:acyl-CoA thioesterase-1